jgi:predicted transcriptional regulator
MANDTRTTVYLDPADYRRLKAMARAQGRPTAALIREAVAEYANRAGAVATPSSIGAGRSRTGTVAERAEELLEGMGAPRRR